MKKFLFVVSDSTGKVIFTAGEYGNTKWEALAKLMSSPWEHKDKARFDQVEIYVWPE